MSQKQARSVMAPVAILAVLLALVVGAQPGLASLGGSRDARLTPTPTKTARPPLPAAGPAPLDLVIVAPAATALPTVAPPAARPAATATAGSLTPYLADVARRYGIDTARRFVVVDPDQQRMTVWDPGRPLREFPVSTGDERRGYRTPAWYGLVGRYWGTFHAFGAYADDGWYLFEDAGSILIHGAPYVLENGAKVYEDMDALGNYPASRGCIRLRPEDARWFTAWNPEGVPLVILPHAPAS